MTQSNKIWLFVGIVVVLPIVAYWLVKTFEDRYNNLPILGDEGHTVLQFDLKDQNGNKINVDDWEDKIIVANFFFTHCPSICPKMMMQLRRVKEAYGNDIELYSFSVDPERDTPERLRRYANQTNNNWHLVTGDKKELYRFARKELLITATDGDGGSEDFIHSDNLILIDRNKRIRGYYKGIDREQVDQMIKDIRKLKKEKN